MRRIISAVVWLATGSLLSSAIPASFGSPASAGATVADVSRDYRFVTFDYPGSPGSFPLGINSRGDVVGFYLNPAGVAEHGYLWRHGTFTTIDVPGATATGAFGINDRGAISGTYFDAAGFQHGFLRTLPDGCDETAVAAHRCRPAYKKFDVPGAAQTLVNFEFGPGLGTAAIGLNDAEQIVGMYATNEHYSNGFVRSDDHYVGIDNPYASHSKANGTKLFSINDQGLITGDYMTQAGPSAPHITHGFTLNNGGYTAIDVPGSQLGGFGTQVNGLNDAGTAVGVYSDPGGVFHGLLWKDGRPGTVDVPGMPYNEVHAINVHGELTGGYATDPGGLHTHGYLAFPK